MNQASLTIAASFAIALAAFAGFVVVLLHENSRAPDLPSVAAIAPPDAPTRQLHLAPPPRSPVPLPAIGRFRYALIGLAFLVWSLAISDHLVRH